MQADASPKVCDYVNCIECKGGCHLRNFCQRFFLTASINSIYRLMQAARTSKNPLDRFDFVLEEVNALSGLVSSYGSQLAILSDVQMVTQCRVFEEICGRVNESQLNHFMVMGAPSYPKSDSLQANLKKQVPEYSRCKELSFSFR